MKREAPAHVALAACALLYGGAALADTGGCRWEATGNYQIGQTAEVVVSSDIPAGTVVRDSPVFGDGSLVATCEAGIGNFEGAYIGTWHDGMVPLTVGGKPSGFGLELYLTDPHGVVHGFPHHYQRVFEATTPVLTSDISIAYRIRRLTSDPVAFGRVDQFEIAKQWAYQPDGAPTDAFRMMKIYEMYFVRTACSITAESLNQTVDLGDYHVGEFATPDRATPWQPFRLTVQECKDPAGLIANITFGTAADADAVNGHLFSLPADGPENVGLELADADRHTLAPGATASFGAIGSGEDYTFNVRLRETRPTVRGGRFTRPVSVMVEFL